MSEQDKAVSRRVIEEGFNKGNLQIVDEVIAVNYVNHSAPPGLPPDREGIKAFIGMYRAAFPDLHTIINDQIAEGDQVVTRWTAEGTNMGNLFGMPSTGKHATINGILIDRVVGAKIVETWNSFVQLGMMQQLGLIPPAPNAQASAAKPSAPAGRPEMGQPGSRAPM